MTGMVHPPPAERDGDAVGVRPPRTDGGGHPIAWRPASMRRPVRALALAALATLLLAAPTAAAKPEMDHVQVDDVFVDGFLSEMCGTEITAHVTGHITFRAFVDGDVVVRELNNYALSAVYESAHGSVRVKDVGVDRVRYLADGSIVNVIVGNVQSIQVPGQGRVYSDVGQATIHITFDENGEGTVEVLSSAGQHDEDQVGPLCDALDG
jgi:hypothetical protein